MNAYFGRIFAVPGRRWKAELGGTPAVHAVSRWQPFARSLDHAVPVSPGREFL
jgi:hypothetical protein